MSYDIELAHPVTKKVLELDWVHHMRGGTYQTGGSKELSLNITWNYSDFYYKFFGDKGIRTIYGMTGATSIPVIQQVVDKLGADVTDNYWEPSEGNAKAALLQLIALAQLRPDGIWQGD